MTSEQRFSRASTRLRWAAAASFLLIGLLLLSLRVSYRFTDRMLGFVPLSTDVGFLVDSVTPDTPAARGDLQAGDRFLAIDGQPVRNEDDYDQVASRFRRDTPLRVEVLRGDQRGEQRVELELIPGLPFDWRGFLFEALAFFAYLSLGLVASSREASDLRATLLAAFCLAVALELSLLDLPYVRGQILARLTYLLVSGLQFGLDLHLATVLPTTPGWFERQRWVRRFYYAVGLGIGLFAAVSAIGSSAGVPGFDALEGVSDDIFNNWLLPVWAVTITSLYTARAFRHPDPRGRHQAGLVLLGVLPWFGVVLHDTFAPMIDSSAEAFSSAVWSFALLAYPIAVFVAIYLYRLFDLELVVRKSFLYGSLTTLLVLGFYGIVGAIGALFAREFGGQGVPLWVLSMAGLTMGLVFNPLRSRLQRWIDQQLFPERQALRSRLVRLAAELPAHGKLPRMGEHLARELGRIFAVESVTVWISAPPQGQLLQLASTRRIDGELERTALIGGDDPAVQHLARVRRPIAASALKQLSAAMGQRLVEADAELVVPLLAQERLAGLLAFSKKREGQRYLAEELELLTLVGHHVATVFENARLFDSATYEGLTGLFRREALLEILDREWSRAQRYGRPLAVALADLDHFKGVNDRHGHLNGDLVLQRVAAELRGMLRETDFIGRYGGEEFLMVLPETTLEGGRQLAEKIRQKIEELRVPIEGQELVQVTVSIGIASRDEIRADARVRARALIGAADEALYAAKNNGRNRVEAAVAH